MNEKLTIKEIREAKEELENSLVFPSLGNAYEKFNEKTGIAIHEITYTFLNVTQLKDLPNSRSVPGVISVSYFGGYL